jgi:hypothetical protein
MALSDQDLFRIEMTVRARAERTRREAEAFDDGSTAVSATHARGLRQEADELDMAADLLVGLQGDWATLGPLVRDGYQRLKAEHERIKAAAAAAKAEAA